MIRLITGLVCLFSLLTFGQNETSNWFFGYHAGLKFLPDGTIETLAGSQMNTTGSSVMSDTNGQLLFYTNGVTVWDRNHIPMPNGSFTHGTSLLGSRYNPNTAIILPHPTNPNRYYVFTCDAVRTDNAQFYPSPNPNLPLDHDDGLNNGLNYSIVDLSITGSNGSVGNVVVRNQHLVTYDPDPNGIQIKYKCSNKLTAYKDENTNSYWIVTQFIDRFLAFKVDVNGVNPNPVVSVVGFNNMPSLTSPYWEINQIKFNAFGTQIALIYTDLQSQEIYPGRSELFDFDIYTGIVSNRKIVFLDSEIVGVEFSPNGQFLYHFIRTEGLGYPLYQFNLLSPNFPNDYLILPVSSPSFMQLANNGKIYTSEYNNGVVVINNPNVLGIACLPDVIYPAFPTPNSSSFRGVPHFLVNLIIPPLDIQNFCLGTPTVFGFNNFQSATNIVWQFGDGNSSTLANPSHTYTMPGNYQVSLSYIVNGQIKNQSRNITIHPVPIAHAIGAQNLCMNSQQESINLKSLYDSAILNGQSASLHQVFYYASQNDLNNNNPISQPESFNSQANLTLNLFVKVINNQDSNCSATTSFTLQTFLKPLIQNQPTFFVCQQSYTGQHVFQLSDYNQQLTSNNNLLQVTYYATQQDGEQQNNTLPLSYTNIFPEETIYYRLHHNLNPDCYSIGSFQLIVNPQPQALNPFTWYHCDTDTNGIMSINLLQQNTNLLQGLNPNRYVVTYHLALNEANNQLNAINPTFTNSVAQTTIYYRLTNVINNNCHAVGQFEVVVTPHTVVNQPPVQYFCVLDNTQPQSFNLQDFYPLILNTQNPLNYHISFHPTFQDAQNQSLVFSNPYQNSHAQETWYARITNTNNPLCVYYTNISIDIQNAATAHPAFPLATCDDNTTGGVASFNLGQLIPNILQNQPPSAYQVSFHLTQQEATQGLSPLSLNYTNINNPQTIYARVSNTFTSACFDTEAVSLIVYPKPYTDQVIEEPMCDGVPKRLEVPSGFASYLWNTGATQRSIMVNMPEQYWVDVVQNYSYASCSGRLYFNVVASGLATIERLEKIEFMGGKNQITVVISGLGDYEYSLDDVNYQDSPVFSNLNGGIYTVYVRDKKGCGVINQLLYLLDAPLFFTPNGDGYNDTWHITSARLEQNMMVYIYDRFGKLIQSLKPNDGGWNGSYNSQLLPSSDYWYVVERANQPLVKGHFSLKR